MKCRLLTTVQLFSRPFLPPQPRLPVFMAITGRALLPCPPPPSPSITWIAWNNLAWTTTAFRWPPLVVALAILWPPLLAALAIPWPQLLAALAFPWPQLAGLGFMLVFHTCQCRLQVSL